MAQRRRNELELNFDSLTDLITNLAGGFILLVLLLMGVTRPAQSQNKGAAESAPTPAPAAPESGDRAATPLRLRLNALRTQVQSVDQEIGKLREDLPSLRTEVDELLKKVDSLQPPKPEKPKEEAKKVTKVPFRPPLEHDVPDLKTRTGFVCRNDRVFVIDFEGLIEEVNKLKGPISGSVTISPPGGDYTLKIPEMELLPKAGHDGETIDEILRPDSNYQKAVNAGDRRKDVLQFAVYPDSFAVFRAARNVTWEKKFESGLAFVKEGKPINLGRGSVAAQ